MVLFRSPGRTTSSSIQYPHETGFTNSAVTHTETAGTAKPQSEIKFDIKTATVTTIAHWVLATRQILDDVAMLQSYIDGRLRYGLAYAEELRSEEHTSELQSLMRISYAVFCLKKKQSKNTNNKS